MLVHEGNVVKANETTLAVINQIRPIYVAFSVPRAGAAGDPRSAPAAGRCAVEAYVAAIDGTRRSPAS